MLNELIGIELWKLWKKPRAWIAFIAIAVLIGAIHLVVALQGEQLSHLALQGIEQHLSIEGRIVHGYIVAFIVQGLLLVHLPFLIALVGGDLIAGESAAGTLRLLVIQPIPRWQIAIAKIVVLGFYATALVFFLASLALGGGVAAFSTGDLLVLSSKGLVVIPENEVLLRFVLAYLYNVLGLFCVGLLALMLGCFADNPLGPVLGTIAIVIVMTALSLLDVPLIEQLKDLFFTTHIAAWRLLFEVPIPRSHIFRSLVIILMHCFAFSIVAALKVQYKDILN